MVEYNDPFLSALIIRGNSQSQSVQEAECDVFLGSSILSFHASAEIFTLFR